jgi:hypothetical protein
MPLTFTDSGPNLCLYSESFQKPRELKCTLAGEKARPNSPKDAAILVLKSHSNEVQYEIEKL